MSKVEFYHLYAKATSKDGSNHIVTVVGKLEKSREPVTFTEKVPVEYKPGSFVDGELKYTKKLFKRKLTLGLSICHPLDRFDEEVGVEIAKGRIERGEALGSLETNSVTMLTEDAVQAELLIKLQYIIDNIDDYLPEEF